MSLLVLGAAGCNDDDDDNNNPPPPPPPESTFNLFVLEQFADTANDTEPAETNDRAFTFSENPNAFNSLFD